MWPTCTGNIEPDLIMAHANHGGNVHAVVIAVGYDGQFVDSRCIAAHVAKESQQQLPQHRSGNHKRSSSKAIMAAVESKAMIPFDSNRSSSIKFLCCLQQPQKR